VAVDGEVMEMVFCLLVALACVDVLIFHKILAMH